MLYNLALWKKIKTKIFENKKNVVPSRFEKERCPVHQSPTIKLGN